MKENFKNLYFKFYKKIKKFLISHHVNSIANMDIIKKNILIAGKQALVHM